MGNIDGKKHQGEINQNSDADNSVKMNSTNSHFVSEMERSSPQCAQKVDDSQKDIENSAQSLENPRKFHNGTLKTKSPN